MISRSKSFLRHVLTGQAAVLAAYGCTELLDQCRGGFLLDYEEEEEGKASGEASGRKRKKPWRYRWPDEIRDEVLARVLKLNAERAQEEKLAGLTAATTAPPKRRKGQKAKRGTGAGHSQGDLLHPPQTDLFNPPPYVA